MRKNINDTIFESIGNKNVQGLVKDYGELALDQVLSDEAVKKIPVIGTLINITQLGYTIKDHIFTKKVLKFLFELESIGYTEKKEFIDEVNYNPKFRTKVGEHLVLILERIDDLEKPAILGRLFKSTLNKQIPYETFLRLSSILIRSFSPDLIALKDFSNTGKISKIAKENLANQGLLSVEIIQGKKSVETILGVEQTDVNELEYRTNSLSELLIKYGLE